MITKMAVLDVLKQSRKPMTTDEIAEALHEASGSGRRSVCNHLGKLKRAGLARPVGTSPKTTGYGKMNVLRWEAS